MHASYGRSRTPYRVSDLLGFFVPHQSWRMFVRFANIAGKLVSSRPKHDFMPIVPNGHLGRGFKSMGTERAQTGHSLGTKQKRPLGSGRLLSAETAGMLVARARFELWVMSVQTRQVACLVCFGKSCRLSPSPLWNPQSQPMTHLSLPYPHRTPKSL